MLCDNRDKAVDRWPFENWKLALYSPSLHSHIEPLGCVVLLKSGGKLPVTVAVPSLYLVVKLYAEDVPH